MAKGKYRDWLTEDGLLRIEGWAREGLTDEQIAGNVGCSYSTFRVWLEKYPALSAALKKGKRPADIQVENALFKRAIGYDYTEETSELRFDKKTGKYEMKVVKTVKKHMPPDVTAIIFWLKNRKKEFWRDRQDYSLLAEVEDLGEIEEEIYGTVSSSEKKNP